MCCDDLRAAADDIAEGGHAVVGALQCVKRLSPEGRPIPDLYQRKLALRRHLTPSTAAPQNKPDPHRLQPCRQSPMIELG